jgi:hypothetical protein
MDSTLLGGSEPVGGSDIAAHSRGGMCFRVVDYD